MRSNLVYGYIGLFVFFITAVLFKGIINSIGLKQKKEAEKYLLEEHKANFSRTTESPDNLYYTPNTNVLHSIKLPSEYQIDDKKYMRILSARKRALKISEQTMLRLDPPMKNIEIKRRFGIANFENIITYEYNYEQYIRALANLAAELIKLELDTDAERILLVCMQMNAQIFLPYSLLCDLYKKSGRLELIEEIRFKINNTPILSENYVLCNKINDYID